MPTPRVLRGNDPTVPRLWNVDTRSDVSGLSQNGFREGDVTALIDMTQELLQQLCAEAPRALVELLPTAIPLYGKPPQILKASILTEIDDHPEDFEERREGTVVRHARKSMDIGTTLGIALGIRAEEFRQGPQEAAEHIRHELLHLFVNPLVPTVPVEEALAERLNREHTQHSKFPIKHLPWTGDRFSSTAGVNTEDFATVRQSPGFIMVMTIASIEMFRRQSREAVWTLCETLARDSGVSRNRRKPTSGQLRDAMTTAFGKEERERLEQEMVMRPLQAGTQSYLFPAGPDMLFAASLNVEENPTYLQRTPGWDHRQFLVSDIRKNTISFAISVEGYDRPLRASMPIERTQAIHFADIAAFTVQSLNYAIPVSAIQKIDCSLGGVRCSLTPAAPREISH